MLDFSAHEAELGKTVGDDFRDGKITLPIVVAFARGDAEEAAPIARRLARASAAVAVVAPPGADRLTVGRHIAAAFATLLMFLDRPGTLFVAGGEMLRQVCDCLGAERLDVDGEIVRGVPASILRGGRWDGLRVISKSGAFGDAGLLLRLLRLG